jgi:hypothetical protein
MVIVGPDRRGWLWERLETIRRVSGVDVARYVAGLNMEYHDLHGTGYATYADRMPWTTSGIEMHPTYEGKICRYFHENGIDLGGSTFWIVGSEPSRAAMLDAFMLDGLPVDWAVAA